ncbi:MAG: hypothetical protein CME69_04115 [Halobacteriovorax sp.]|nr:hypothetical protein [Halobacteriovorax sp.]
MEMENLTILDSLPEEFFKSSAQGLFKIFNSPTLVHLKSEVNNPDKKAIFISSLLHGNEHSGVMSVQELLQSTEKLDRDLILFFGNIKAAKYGKRHLDSQLDYNRIWTSNSPFVKKTLAYLEEHDVELCIDLHNNTGNNPCYSCISQKSIEHYNLAYQFSDKIVYFTDPIDALSVVLSKKWPSVTIEAGKSGDPVGIYKTVNFLKKVIQGIDLKAPLEVKPRVFHTIGKIRVDIDDPVTFEEDEFKGDGFLFRHDLETLNFSKLSGDSWIGRSEKLPVIENYSKDPNRSLDYFELQDDLIVCKKPFIPAMLTHDIEIIYSDCLGYIMEEEIIELKS